MIGKKFQTRDYGEATISETHYTTNERKCIILNTKMGRITLTTNVSDARLEKGEFCIKNWSENVEVAEDAINSGLFIDTGKKIHSGHVLAPIWRYALPTDVVDPETVSNQSDLYNKNSGNEDDF